MLGEQIGEGRGKRTGRRVIAIDPSPKVEVSFEDQGTLLGVEGMNVGTYVSCIQADGSLHGDGQGIFATMDGETVTWRGIGVGRLSPGGSVHYSGSLSYTTTSQKLSPLNGISGVFEFNVDAEGNTSSKAWAWTNAAATQSAGA